MQPFVAALPVLPGKESQAKIFAKELNRRMREFDESEKRLGVAKEFWSLAPSPQGSMLLVYFEAQDIEKVFTHFANSKDQFDIWAKGQVKEITGVDLGVPPSGPLPERLLLYGY